MKVTGYTCPKCGDIVFSRARHDMRWCSCKSIAVDGGLDYVKISTKKGVAFPESCEVEFDATPKEMYDDWNYSRNKFGLIKAGSNNGSNPL